VNGKSKDIWMMSYSPALTMGVWLGNPDTSPLKNGNSSIPGPIINKVMAYAHEEVYAKAGKWKQGDWYAKPDGVQKIGSELFPSWYNKNKAQQYTKLTFDKVSKKKATDCTPEAARVEVNVIKTTDSTTKKDSYSASDGYDGNSDDDVHQCGDAIPSIASIAINPAGVGNYNIVVTVTQGKASLTGLTVSVNGTTIDSKSPAGSGSFTTPYSGAEPFTVTATVTDSLYYTGTGSKSRP